MVLNRKSFFLELGEPAAKAAEPKSQPEETVALSNSELSQPAAATDPVETEIPAPVAAAVDVAPEAESVAAEVSSQASAEVDNEPAPTLTMAESLAAELADAQAARPQIKLVTFAPEALQPGNSVRPGKRRPGNNLAGFRSMATDLFKT
tara:strand:+ start:383 stop:829 length:447 start_codon:yes stop_codon:yes gene_type:complete